MKKKYLIIIAILCFLLLTGTIIYAAITTTTSTRGNLEVTSKDLSIATEYTKANASDSWVYNQSGEKKELLVNLNNSSGSDLHVYYEFNINGTIEPSLLSAILVYYNGEYIDTLDSLTNNSNRYVNSPYAFAATGKTTTDTFTFELHQSASNSIFNKKEIAIDITTYSESIDYTKYAIIKNEDDFYKIIDDINSGLLDVVPTIVLENTITLTKAVTIIEPTIIQTNGYNLTGEITVNDDKSENPNALLTVLGDGLISSVTVGSNYDKAGARELIASHIQKKLKYGIRAGSTPEAINIIGPYTFYPNITIASSGSANYSNSVLTASSKLQYSSTEAITLSDSLGSSVIKYKHVGFKSDFEDIFIHLPNNKIITNDLFLPTYVPKCNAAIEWKSSNPSIFSKDGRILGDNHKNEAIILTATIKINNNVFVRTFSFNVTSNNNMVNFQKLVKDISPLVITKTYLESDDAGTSYYLPIVTNNTDGSLGTYDYRTSYDCPNPDPTFNWAAHKTIGLTELKYEKYYDKDSEGHNVDNYPYINVTDNKVTLIEDTLSNYAKIKVTGTFDNGEVCESIVNISIALGSNTELLEKAFNHINKCLDEISVLGNIITTRKNLGIINEKGDFTLPATYDEDYAIVYENVDESRIFTISENAEEDVFNFSVDPTKFYSVETSIPVKATVTYSKSASPITKTKIIYITVPAALHIKDLGNVSIFNSLKYQVINSLLEKEKNNNGYETNGSLLTYSGYDYILLRDIVGDVQYLNDYAFNNLYLTVNEYQPDGSNGAQGTTTITLTNSPTNDSGITDTLAYDFITLIHWATCDKVKPVSDVISSSGQDKISLYSNVSSNGETYLTENELSVIEAYYKACTNDTDGLKWNEIKAQVLETAPGRVYDNTSLLVTLLECLTTEKGINSGWYEGDGNGAYGKIYAKYLEVVNRYATTTSENEEPMSPAQEVYNSKYYYSFTNTAQNSTETGKADISFACKYYNETGELVSGYCNRYGLPESGEFRWQGLDSGNHQGVYAATKKTGWNNGVVDIYANAEGAPYDSDKTKYITSAELMVLKAFWLGTLAETKDETTNSTRGVLHTFSAESIAKIESALAAVNGIKPYPDYTIDDFQCYGQAILNALDACLTIPTTFTSNGIGLLINSFYENYNGTGYQLRKYNNAEDTSSFTSLLIDGIPAVTNLDSLEGVLSYFSQLSSINIIGNENIAIYLSDYGLSTTFARICLTNKQITSLNMQYVSSNWNHFDITNIKNLNYLTEINISNNLGIKSVYPLLNINRNNYTSVNFFNIGEVFEYNEFVIDNLPAALVYSNVGGSREERPAATITSSPLVYLSDIEDLVSEHLYLTNVIYDENGNQQNVCWRIEEGNEINGEEINLGGELDKIDKINDINSMNMRLSPYFYCSENFEYNGESFTAKHLYKITYNNNVASFEDISNAMYMVDTANSEAEVKAGVLDINGTIGENIGEEVNMQAQNETNKVITPTETISQTVYVHTLENESNVKYTISMYYHVFSFRAHNEFRYQDQDPGDSSYYLMANGTELKAGYLATPDASCYMVILNEEEAQFIKLLNDNGNEVTDDDMKKSGLLTKLNTETKILTLGTQDLSSPVDTCYIYNVKEKKFMYSGGFDTKLGDQFSITISDSNYRIRNVTSDQYLDAFKQLITDNGKGSNVISAVFNTSSPQTWQSLLTPRDSHARLYNSNWTLDTVNQGSTNIIGDKEYSYTASYNTPIINITTKEGKTYTASFNCYTIRNARRTNIAEDVKYYNNITKTSGSKGYLYDNGATLLLSIEQNQPTDEYLYYFCLMTDAEITALEEWYKGPTKDMSFGGSVSRENKSYYEYYIYNPFTRRYAAGDFSNNPGTAFSTTSVKPKFPFALGYHSSTKDGDGDGYFVSQIGMKAGAYNIATDIVTESDFNKNKSELYYVPVGSDSEIKVTDDTNATYNSQTFYYRKLTTNQRGFYLKSWNAYGGIKDSCYGIATWGYDSGSLWVFDEVQADNSFTYSITEKSEKTKQIAYSLSYTINKVSTTIVNSQISRYYEFDKYYYLNSDVTIDNILYKKGSLIRFEYNAYKGKANQATIISYEVVFKYTKADETEGTIVDPKDLDFIYYDSENPGGAVGSIEYFNCTENDFTSYKQGFKITIGTTEKTVTYDDIGIEPGSEKIENEAWHDEVKITRFYSHVKNVNTAEIEQYKNDVSNLNGSASTIPTVYQYLGSTDDSENIYSNPFLTYVYEPLLPGFIKQSNWGNYKAIIYSREGNNYISYSDKDWSADYANISFYKRVLRSTENITASNVSYENSAIYALDKSNTNIFGLDDDNVLIWNFVSSGNNNTGMTMDQILEEANNHFYDSSYNLYYGKYYGYNGFNMATQLDTTTMDVVQDNSGTITNVYHKGYIYRLVENSDRTGFMWKEVSEYYRKAGDKMVADASTGEGQVGDIIWATSACFADFYTANKFYRIVEDDFTETLNVVQFTDVTITNSTNYTDIQSQKIQYIYESDYLGYAGTYEIVISAMIRIPNEDGTYSYTDYIKQYKIKFVGTVIQ